MLLKRLNISIRLLTVSLLCSLAPSLLVKAAEQIYLIYGPIYWPVKVSSLEIFAKDGTIKKDLRAYLRATTPEQQAQFREALLKRVDINPIMLSRFFNTEIGEDILTRIGKGLTIALNRKGKYALRAAIVQAALDPEGLTLLNFLHKLPTNMELQGELLLGLSQEIDKVIKATIHL